MEVKEEPRSPVKDFSINCERLDMSQNSSCDYSLSQFKDEECSLPVKSENETESEENNFVDVKGEPDDEDYENEAVAEESEEDIPLSKRKKVETDSEDEAPLIARKRAKTEKKEKKKKRVKEESDFEDEDDESDYGKSKKKKAKKEPASSAAKVSSAPSTLRASLIVPSPIFRNQHQSLLRTSRKARRKVARRRKPKTSRKFGSGELNHRHHRTTAC